MGGVAGLGRDAREGDHHQVGGRVGNRMHGIGDHRTAAPRDSGDEFARRQKEIYHETHEGHAVNPAFAYARRQIHFIVSGSRVSRIWSSRTTCTWGSRSGRPSAPARSSGICPSSACRPECTASAHGRYPSSRCWCFRCSDATTRWAIRSFQ